MLGGKGKSQNASCDQRRYAAGRGGTKLWKQKSKQKSGGDTREEGVRLGPPRDIAGKASNARRGSGTRAKRGQGRNEGRERERRGGLCDPLDKLIRSALEQESAWASIEGAGKRQGTGGRTHYLRPA